MQSTLRVVASWVIVAWTCKVFLFSLPYKFSRHPDTQHIFGTIGEWMQGIFGYTLGRLFSDYGPFVVGAFELLTSLVLLAPLLLWCLVRLGANPRGWTRMHLHRIGGLMASAVMLGAVFFHLFTPLGIEVLHEGESDGGSLFYAALSILVLGVVLFLINPVKTPR
ncbi:MAG: hypothetical protein MPK31_06460 [Gammaproteobacteria bacterium]|nr:hypothetical protein [Gammaproteobacteria bacterium]MDA8007481.1 hypothetical protein [Gammaproteobacteria bacterium]MDA8011775.1 hypothetical protein [Gammaproteobacteria bacterium]MDA8015600.1 hypothetical protein [Gammaproteobacteria bacterium]